MRATGAVGFSAMFAVGMAGLAVAGSIDSPGLPSAGSGMYTLGNLYEYVVSGTALEVKTDFQGPASGPGPTMENTRQIGDALKTSFEQCDVTADKVLQGTKFFSTVAGSWGVRTGTMSLPNTWIKRHKITVDYTKVPTAAKTDFPVLLSDGNFLDEVYANTQAAGQDLRFTTDAGGVTEMAFEIVSWDTANRKAEVYVKVPVLSSTANTVFYVWYGNPTVGAYGETDTYGKHNAWNSNYKIVHHLNGAAETALDDSTANNVDIAGKDGTPTFNVAAKWGKGVSFGGNSDVYIGGFSYTGGNCTALVVYKTADVTGTQGIFSIGRAAARGFALYPNGYGSCPWSLNALYGPDCGGNAGANWYFYTGSYNGTKARAYLNGAYFSEAAGAAPASGSGDLILGALSRSTFYAKGIIEEVRYSNVQRADDWITTEYNNLNEPLAFSVASEGTQVVRFTCP